jgi:hypothetical protein
LRTLAAEPAGESVFEYSSFGGYEGMFCGYAGYNRAKIPAVNVAFVANLAKAYDRIRENQPKELVENVEDGVTTLTETNGIRVLFYPQEFEFPRFRLGLRYNEKWVEETEKFGHQADYIRVCEIVDDKDAVVESWRDSTRVGSFAIVPPKMEVEEEAFVNAPMTIKGKVKALVVPARPLKEYFRPRDGLASVLIVDSEGIDEYVYDENAWSKKTDSE